MPRDYPTPWDDHDERKRARSPNRKPRHKRPPRAWRGEPLSRVLGYVEAATARYEASMGTAADTKKLLGDALRDTLDLTTQHREMMDEFYPEDGDGEDAVPAGVRARMLKIRQALDINSKVIQRVAGVSDKLLALDAHGAAGVPEDDARRLAETYGIDLDAGGDE